MAVHEYENEKCHVHINLMTDGAKWPAGGTAGQALIKASGRDGDVTWGNVAAAGGGGGDCDCEPVDLSGYAKRDELPDMSEYAKSEDIAHELLSDLQGGREGEHYHLTYEEYHHLPFKPEIISPEDGAVGVNQVPQIAGTTYAHPDSLPMHRKQMQLATDAEFGSVAYDTGEELSMSVVFQVPLGADSAPLLREGTVYYARIRYMDRRGKWSAWSDSIHFETMNEFPDSIPVAPMMLAPLDGGVLPAVDPVLVMSQPKVMAGTAIFDKADWQISTDNTFGTQLYSAEGTASTTMHATRDVDLTSVLGVDFYARGRQGTTTGEYTPWSVPVHFSIKPDYDAPIFGFRRIFSNTFQQPFIYHIDEDGEIVHIRQSYFDNHPLYALPDERVLVGTASLSNTSLGAVAGEDFYSDMKYIMPCWIKLRVYDDEEGSMVIDEWFSASDMSHHEGWILHPAFERSPHGILVGVSTANTVNIGGKNCCVSVKGNNGGTYAEVDMTNLIALDPTWHNITIYERQLLCDLCAAESKSLIISRLITLWGVAGWRGVSKLITNTGGAQGASNNSLNGFKYTITDSEVRQYQITMPNFAENVLKLNIAEGAYPSAGKVHPTSVLRGYADELGFDIALLGLVGSGEVSDGTLEDKYHQNALYSGAMSAVSTKYGGTFKADYSGAYGMIGGSGTGQGVYRVAKWIA